jgi:solute carrier family 35 protein E3
MFPQVFTNKAIFSDPSLKLAQLTFAAFHFFITWVTLFTLSRPRFAMFVPRRVAIKEIIPLAIAMALNVILPNLSLAFSTVTFYQVARILLTPMVALMNYVLYKSTLPRNAIYALIPACLGVGMVSYYDSLPTQDANVKTTSGLGVVFAFSGIFASSLYTVWISSYHKKLQMNSMQLLFNQAPLAAFMLLYVIPFVDTFPVWTEVPINRWIMILMVCYTRFQYAISAFLVDCDFVSATRLLLTIISYLVWLLCLHNQHVPILHHCANWPRIQHSCRPCQDLLNCRSGLDCIRTCCRR